MRTEKRSLMMFVVLALVGLLAYFVLAADNSELNQVIILSPTNNSIISGYYILNATVNDHNTTNVTFYFMRVSDSNWTHNTTIVNVSVGVTNFTNSSFNTLVVPDGVYNLNITAWNATMAGGGGNSVSNITGNVTIDNTAPVATFANPANNSNYSTQNLNFNVSIVDNITISWVKFQFDNGTGNSINYTAHNFSGVWGNNSIPLTFFAEDLYHYVNVFVNDTRNNSAASAAREVNITFTVDRTAPNFTFFNFSFNVTAGVGRQNLTTDTTPDLYVNVTDNVFGFLYNCTLYINGVANVTSNTTNKTMANFTVPNVLGDKAGYSLHINCTDGSGNRNITNLIYVTVDTTAPAVTNFGIVNNTNYSASSVYVNFNVSIVDATTDTNRVFFEFSNGSGTPHNISIGANSSGNVWNISQSQYFNINSLTEGHQRLKVYANDSLGNFNVTEMLYFAVDRTAPNFTFFNFSFNVTAGVGRQNLTTDTTPDLYVNVTDNVFGFLYNCTLYINGVANVTSNTTNKTMANFTVPNVLGDKAGYSLHINCTDGSGNRNITNLIYVTVDTTAPAVTNFGIANNSNLSGSNASNRLQNYTNYLNFNVSIVDATTDTNRVFFEFSNGSGTPHNISIGANSSGNVWNISQSQYFNINSLTEGRQRLKVYANDSLGNFNVTEVLYFTVDRTPPLVRLINATAFDTDDATPSIYFNVSDNLFNSTNCTLYFNGVSYGTSAAAENDSINITIITASSSVPDASGYTMQVNCSDSAGNVGNSTLVTNIRIDAGAPSINTVSSTATTISVITSEVATCKYDTSDKTYASMANTMSGASSTSHSASGLSSSTTYYVRCQDTSSPPNVAETSTTVTTTESEGNGGGSGGGGGGGSSAAAAAVVSEEEEEEAVPAEEEEAGAAIGAGDEGIEVTGAAGEEELGTEAGAEGLGEEAGRMMLSKLGWLWVALLVVVIIAGVVYYIYLKKKK